MARLFACVSQVLTKMVGGYAIFLASLIYVVMLLHWHNELPCAQLIS